MTRSIGMCMVVGCMLLASGVGVAQSVELSEPAESYSEPKIEELSETGARSPHDPKKVVHTGTKETGGWAPGAKLSVSGQPWVGLLSNARAWGRSVSGAANTKGKGSHPQVQRSGTRTVTATCSGTYDDYVEVYVVEQIVFKGNYETAGPIEALSMKDFNVAYDIHGTRHKFEVNIRHDAQGKITAEGGVELGLEPKAVLNLTYEKNVTGDSSDAWSEPRIVYGVYTLECNESREIGPVKTTHEPSIMIKGWGVTEGPTAEFRATTLHYLQVYDAAETDQEGDDGDGPSTPNGDGGSPITPSDTDYPGQTKPTTGPGSQPPSGPADPNDPFIDDDWRKSGSPNRGIGGKLVSATAPPSKLHRDEGAELVVPETAYLGRPLGGKLAFYYTRSGAESVDLTVSGSAVGGPSTVTRAGDELNVDVPLTVNHLGEVTITATFDDGAVATRTVSVVALPAAPTLSLPETSVALLTTRSTPHTFWVMRSDFSDFYSNATEITVSAHDPSGVLSALPTSLTIPVGEHTAGVGFDPTGVPGTAEVTFTVGSQSESVTVSTIDVGDLTLRAYDPVVHVGETETHRFKIEGLELGERPSYTVQLVGGYGIATVAKVAQPDPSHESQLGFTVTAVAEGVATVELAIEGETPLSFEVHVVPAAE